jgi:hypothetical protein
MRELRKMLTYCRPEGSFTEWLFCERFIAGLPGMQQDEHGNYRVSLGDSPVLWSCHTDTVHRHAGRQRVHVADDIFSLTSPSSCLGADDTAGIWLMRQMILRGIPGHYVFHYGEEVGGLGSSSLAEYEPEWLAQIKWAIALDRAGFTDVITHQGGWRCCSNSFAEALAEGLGLGYQPCDSGIYTDTAEYTQIVPECTNLSVGYLACHSAAETLDGRHLLRLLDALCALDVDALPCERDPAVDEDLWKDDYDYYHCRQTDFLGPVDAATPEDLDEFWSLTGRTQYGKRLM